MGGTSTGRAPLSIDEMVKEIVVKKSDHRAGMHITGIGKEKVPIGTSPIGSPSNIEYETKKDGQKVLRFSYRRALKTSLRRELQAFASCWDLTYGIADDGKRTYVNLPKEAKVKIEDS